LGSKAVWPKGRVTKYPDAARKVKSKQVSQQRLFKIAHAIWPSSWLQRGREIVREQRAGKNQVSPLLRNEFQMRAKPREYERELRVFRGDGEFGVSAGLPGNQTVMERGYSAETGNSGLAQNCMVGAERTRTGNQTVISPASKMLAERTGILLRTER
jgi:hypothetical protein